MSNWAIESFDLTKHYNKQIAVENLSLKVPKGSIFGLVGPDGAGKSTIIKMLSTILPPTSGNAKINGFELLKEKRKIRKNIGYMSEEFTLYQDLSVMENLKFFGDVFGVPPKIRDEKIIELLAFSRLGPFINRRAQYLSGGMKQKLALACTLIHEPQILFLDEPTRGVDLVSRREFWRIITDVNRKGVSIFLSTPYMEEAERCNEIAFLHKGKVLTINTPDNIKKNFGEGLFKIKVKPSSEAKKIIKRLPFIEDVEIFGDSVRVVLRDKGKISILSKALEGLNLKEISEAPLDLEAAFVFLIKNTETKAEENEPAKN